MKILENKQCIFKVVEYLKVGINKSDIKDISKKLNCKIIDLIRTSDKNFKQLNLSSYKDEELLLNAIEKNPSILQRPIVINGNRAIIGRPPEKIIDIL